MKQILLSIKPEYVNLILNKTKRYEFRRTIAKNDINIIYIYSSAPVKKVVAKVKVKNIIAKKPSNLWNITRKWAGISRENFYKYFVGKDIAYAYEIEQVNIFKKPRNLSDYGITTAPQSFVYLNN